MKRAAVYAPLCAFLALVAPYLLVVACQTTGQSQSPLDAAPSERARVAQDWSFRLRHVGETLISTDRGVARASLAAAEHLYREMLERIVSGEGGCQFFGWVQYLRAIAEVRLGDLDAAAWHWQEAQTLWPDVILHLDAYPDVAAFLRQNLIDERRWDDLAFAVADKDVYLRALREAKGTKDGESVATAPDTPQTALKGPITAPTNLKKVHPEYPHAAKATDRGGVSYVECIIDRKGVPRAPVALRSCGVVGFDVAAMEAIREWRYTPARLGGEPASCYLTVTVTFSLR